eukprot:5484830-Prorocentrum_lima.AAC.1
MPLWKCGGHCQKATARIGPTGRVRADGGRKSRRAYKRGQRRRGEAKYLSRRVRNGHWTCRRQRQFWH